LLRYCAAPVPTEITAFKASARNAFYAYQAAVLIFMAEAQQQLKLFDSLA